MNPAIWGPIVWNILTDIARHADLTHTREFIIEFVKILGQLLPCKYCRESYAQYTTSIPIDKFMEKGGTAVAWVWQIHNMVNRKLNKPDLPFFIFEQRIEAVTYMANGEHLFNFLFILASNYDPTNIEKKTAMYKMHLLLPQLIPYHLAAQSLNFGKITIPDLLTQQSYSEWLHRKHVSYGAKTGLIKEEMPDAKYCMLKASVCKSL